MSKLQEEKRKRGSTNVSEVIPQVLATSLFSSFSFPRKKKSMLSSSWCERRFSPFLSIGISLGFLLINWKSVNLWWSSNEMGTWRRQLKAMLRKNWLLKTRHPFVTSAEVSLSQQSSCIFTDRSASRCFLNWTLNFSILGLWWSKQSEFYSKSFSFFFCCCCCCRFYFRLL